MTARTGTGTVRALVVSWNGAHLLPACLDSLLAQTVADQIDIVVVDNASTDGTADLLASAYPQVRVVHSPRNVGFAGGVALGSTGLDQQDLLLLNNDATLAPDAVAQLRTALHAPGAERVGAVTAKILLHGWFHPADEHTARTADRALRSGAGVLVPCRPGDPGARRVVNSTGNVLSRDGAGGDRDWLATDGDERGGPDVWGFSGGAALLRRTALEEVGGFDPSLFLYYEDTDVAWRMRAAGWSIRYVAQAVADHRHAESSDAASPLFRFYNTRNSLVVVTRHAPAVMALRAWGRQGLGWWAALARRSEPGPVLRARARGLGAAAARLPLTLVERRRLWSGAVRSRRQAVSQLG
jgi:hypothetical protein